MAISFRDPAGKVFYHQGEIFRAIYKSGDESFSLAAKSSNLQKFTESKNLVKVFSLDDEEIENILKQVSFENKEDLHTIVKHEKIPFRSYPYEWTPEMLRSGADLTLKISQSLLNEGMGIKDATPYNILFRGTKPVFVDWLSFEKRDVFDPIWLAQSQFIRTFYLPLAVNKFFNLELSSIFTVNRDGLEPEKVYRMCNFWKKLSLPFFSLVTIPKFLSGQGENNSSIYQKKTYSDSEKANFVLSRQFKYLEKLLERVKPAEEGKSEWTDYIGDKQHFTENYLRQKNDFVKESLQKSKPKRVLDVGCNTGYFSRIAARFASVVSIDQDPAVVSKVWQMADKEDLDILPLVVDFSRPSPAIGWRNQECQSFLDRAKGEFDSVMLLAVIHHLLVSERIPLDEIISLVAELTTDTASIEFVSPEDPMFRQIARGRDYLFENLNDEVFRTVVSKYFRIVRYEKLADSNRQLYLLQK